MTNGAHRRPAESLRLTGGARPVAAVFIVAAVTASALMGVRTLTHHGSPAGPVSAALGGGGDGGASPKTAALHTLKVATHPSGAAVHVLLSGGATREGTTPFKARLPEGTVAISLSLKGYNTLTQPIPLDRYRSLGMWLDPAGQLLHEVDQFDVGPAPKQVAFTPDGSQLWVTDLGGDGVEVYDAVTHRKLGDVNLHDAGAVEVVFTRDGRTAYVSQMETASVYEIDAAGRTVRRQLFTKGSWSKYMALSPDEKTLFVSNWVSDDVSRIDLATGDVQLIKTVDTPRGLYVTPDGARLFVAGFGAGDIQRFDLATGESKILLHTGGAMRHLVANPEGTLLYADDMAGDAVYVVDLATEEVHKLATTDHTPNTMDISPDGRVLYVSNRGRNNSISYYLTGPEWGSVLAIDTATGRPLDAIVGGNQTTGLDVSPDGRTLAFSDFLDNRVTMYSIPAYSVLAGGDGGRYRAHFADLAK